VTNTIAASGVLNGRPLSSLTRTALPKTDWAAVTPRQTITRGFTTWISASSQGRQAAISVEDGFLCFRRLPCGSHLKCLTAFVT
jgi:hypothetical protein